MAHPSGFLPTDGPRDGPSEMTTEYDRLTLRSIEAKQRLDEAEQSYQRALNGVDGVLSSARL